MKRFLVNIMASTGITLVTLASVGTLSNARFLFISSVFQSLGANIMINLGFLLTRKFESSYAALEITLDIGYTIIILIIFGTVFDWFTNGTPLLILVIMAVLIYSLGLLIGLFRMREDINAINKLLRKRNNKSNSRR